MSYLLSCGHWLTWCVVKRGLLSQSCQYALYKIGSEIWQLNLSSSISNFKVFVKNCPKFRELTFLFRNILGAILGPLSLFLLFGSTSIGVKWVTGLVMVFLRDKPGNDIASN